LCSSPSFFFSSLVCSAAATAAVTAASPQLTAGDKGANASGFSWKALR